MPRRKLISIIIPVYNESAGLPAFHKALTKVTDRLPYNFEIIFIDDGSRDNSIEVLHRIGRSDPRIRIIEFARNFGKELATTAGLNNCNGNAAVMIDADLQHPVELLGAFIKKWEDGADVVVGIRNGHKKDSFVKKFTSATYYKILSAMAEVEITANATDYRLLDRCVIDHFNLLTERNRMTRGLIDWLGFQREFITYDEKERKFGTAGYSITKLTRLAINSFVAHSLLPLKLAGYLGVLITLLATPLGLFIFIEKYALHNALGIIFSGSAILMVVLLFMVGIVLSSLGLIALYIANIHVEVTGRPLYIVRRVRARQNMTRALDREKAEDNPIVPVKVKNHSRAIASRARKAPAIKK